MATPSSSTATSASSEQAPRCPLCGGPSAGIVIRFPHRVVHRCARCTNGWTYPPAETVPDYESEHFGAPSSDGVAQPRMRFESLPKPWQKLIRMQEEDVAATLPPGGRWLDIGCGDGLLLERLQAKGYRGVGVEPSVRGAPLARSAGLDVYSGYFPHPDVKGPFGAVHISHVLEHIPDVAATLRSIVEIAPGGRLVLSQTNYTGFVPRTLRDRWYAWCEDFHYYHFTPLGLKQVLERRGFQVENLRQASMVHESRRYKYILGLLDRVKWWSDQFVLRARIPERWVD